VRFAAPSLIASLVALTAACSASPPDETEARATSAVYAGELLTPATVARHARAAGVPCGERLVLAVAVAWGESEGYTRATHYNAFDGSTDRGIWQINSKVWSMYSEACVFDPACNAKAMAAISNNGASWTPWLAYTNGRYAQFMEKGREGENAACNGAGASDPSPSNGGSTNVPTGASGGSGASCAELGYDGECVGDVSIWSENGQCRVRDCGGEGKTCGHISSSVGWGCLGGTAGAKVDACASYGFDGRCFGDVLVWVEKGACKRFDCASRGKTCGADGSNGNNCI
jgi:hypothetical protein